MGYLSTKHSYTYSSNGTSIQPGNLNLESQKLSNFWKNDKWKRCQDKREYAFEVSLYEWVPTDEIYDGLRLKMNQVVYPQLEISTNQETVHHLVKQYEDGKYGYAEWYAFCEWYDVDAGNS